MSDFWVNGIVSARDHQPYVQLSNEKGMIAQLTMAQTRVIAGQMLTMAARTEMDAMVYNWFAKQNLPREAAGMMMTDFRDFRSELDAEEVDTREDLPPPE